MDNGLRNINESVNIKKYIIRLAEALIAQYADMKLVDKYDVYQVLLSYWQETMADDIFILVQDGYGAARETELIIEVTEDKRQRRKSKRSRAGKAS